MVELGLTRGSRAEVGPDPWIAKSTVDGHFLKTGKLIDRFKQPILFLGGQDTAGNLDPPELHGGEALSGCPDLFGVQISREVFVWQSLPQTADDRRLCLGLEVPESHRSQFGEFRKGWKVPEIAVVEGRQELANFSGGNSIGIASGSCPQASVDRHIGITPTPKNRSGRSGVELGHALQDRIKQFDGRSRPGSSSIGFEDPTTGSVPVVYGNLRGHEIHAKRRSIGIPVVLIVAIDAAGDVEAAIDRGYQGARQGMEKGGIGYLVEAEVYPVVLETEEEVCAGQACRQQVTELLRASGLPVRQPGINLQRFRLEGAGQQDRRFRR